MLAEGIRARPQPRLVHGSRLIRQGEQSRSVYLVVAGCLILRETATAGAVERTVGFRLPGELAGLEGWASSVQSFTAIATGTTSVCRLSVTPANQACSGALLERLLIKCTVQFERSAKSWRRLPAQERVAAFLEDFAQRSRVKGSVTPLKLPMTRADIGSYLGLAEETVVRALTRLRSQAG